MAISTSPRYLAAAIGVAAAALLIGAFSLGAAAAEARLGARSRRCRNPYRFAVSRAHHRDRHRHRDRRPEPAGRCP